MKNLILLVNLLLALSSHGQDKFILTKDGLTPRSMIREVDPSIAKHLFEATLEWIEENQKEYKLKVEDKSNQEFIDLSSIKWNATNLGERYFIIQYKISIHFKSDHYQFEPTSIQLKLNSKYDMGWKEFDLTDGSTYFKKGKIIKKYKSYLQDITLRLNELNLGIGEYLKLTNQR